MAKNEAKTSKNKTVKIIVIIAIILLFIVSTFTPLYPLRLFILYIMSACIFGFIIIGISKDNKIKKLPKVTFYIMFSILIILFLFQSYRMGEDIVKGPQKAMVTDISIIKRTSSGKYKKISFYITTNIKGEKVKFKIVNDRKKITEKAGKYKNAIIYYYKNAESIESIEFF